MSIDKAQHHISDYHRRAWNMKKQQQQKTNKQTNKLTKYQIIIKFNKYDAFYICKIYRT